jgi:predicted ATP-dependent serine protease
VRTEQFRAEVEHELEQQSKANGTLASDNGQSQNVQHPLIITMDQIKAEKVDWLWSNRIPMGRITLLDGDPGSAKSTLSLVTAAAVSKGLTLPFGEKPKAPANVLLMSWEDGYSDTIRPRLDSAGADVSRVAIPNAGRGLATTMLNASFIEQAVKELGPALLIIDPIITFARGKNTDKATRSSFAFRKTRRRLASADSRATQHQVGNPEARGQRKPRAIAWRGASCADPRRRLWACPRPGAKP